MASSTNSSSRARWGWPLATVLMTLVLALARLVVTPRFYFADDTERGSAGQWWELGDQLLHGHLPMLDPAAWQAGNYWAEGQWGLVNPLTWIIALSTHLTDSLVLHATVVKIVFLAILSLGTYLLSRQFGAHRPWAAVAGVIVPTCGFLVYMDAASWSTDLFNVAVFTWAWWTLRRTVEHRRLPIGYLVASYLLITFGYVFGVIMLVVVLVESLVRHIVRRDGARVVRTLLASVWGAALTIAIYLPGVLTAPVTARGSAPVENDFFLNADLTDLVSAGNGWVSATIRAWDGDITVGPLVSLGWVVLLAPFALPLARSAAKRLIPVFVLGGVALLFTIGPSQMGPIRWPLRLIPYLAIALAVIFAVGISRRFPGAIRPRTVQISIVLVVATSMVTWGNGPYAWKAIGASAVVLIVAILVLGRISRVPVAAVWAFAVTAVITAGQLYFFPQTPLPNRHAPDSFSQLEGVLAGAEGQGLTVGQTKYGSSDAASWDERLMANLWYLSPTEMSSLYTVLPYTTFSEDLCVDLRGETCDQALQTLWSIDPTTGERVSDLMDVSTILAMKHEYPTLPDIPDGWHLVSEGEFTWLLERDEPLPDAGGVVWSSEGTAVTVTSQTDTSVTFTVDEVGSSGLVSLSRLDYPGYRVSGASLADPVRGWLLTVDVSGASAGDSVTVSFRPPGWGIELGSFALAALVGVAWVVVRATRRRHLTAE
ncbi:MAG: hypothetical protein QM607_07555 [Microbacterium sp.]